MPRSCGDSGLPQLFGAPMAVRQGRLGHTEAQTTIGYTHVVKADERRVAKCTWEILHVSARNEHDKRPAENQLTLMIQ
jgi:hypothetical protein